jgi:hypothetical protein
VVVRPAVIRTVAARAPVTSAMTGPSAAQTAVQVTAAGPPGPQAVAPISEFRMGAEPAQNAISARAQPRATKTTACRLCRQVLTIGPVEKARVVKTAVLKMACHQARVSGAAVTTAGRRLARAALTAAAAME